MAYRTIRPQLLNVTNLLDHRVRFFRGIKRQGRLLDIGSGNGHFLALCRSKGYDVQGIEISEWVAIYTTQTLGLSITTGEIDDVKLPTHYFDIITMCHTLEHALDPRQVVLKVKSCLKKDGILAIEMPNYDGTDARRKWQDSIGWQLPYHFYHFTEAAWDI